MSHLYDGCTSVEISWEFLEGKLYHYCDVRYLIAGLMFGSRFESLVDNVSRGDSLVLIHVDEPTDASSISIETPDGAELGWVPISTKGPDHHGVLDPRFFGQDRWQLSSTVFDAQKQNYMSLNK
jgi:hypothetical protein